MNVRVQVSEGTATEATKKGLERICKLCDVISEKFSDEFAKYRESAMHDAPK